MGWFLTRARVPHRLVGDRRLARYPELRLLDRFDIARAVAARHRFVLPRPLAAARASGSWAPAGRRLLIWGFFVSTVVLFHATVTINSLAHRSAARRFATRDNSRNNWLLALITFGEGWHNNHHFFPGSARQGFRWWEIDVTYYLLRVLALCGAGAWDLKPVPAWVRTQAGR